MRLISVVSVDDRLLSVGDNGDIMGGDECGGSESGGGTAHTNAHSTHFHHHSLPIYNNKNCTANLA